MSDTVCRQYINFKKKLSKISLNLISNIADMRLIPGTTVNEELLKNKINPIANEFYWQIDSISFNPLSGKIEVRFSHKPFPKKPPLK